MGKFERYDIKKSSISKTKQIFMLKIINNEFINSQETNFVDTTNFKHRNFHSEKTNKCHSI